MWALNPTIGSLKSYQYQLSVPVCCFIGVKKV